MIDIFEMMTIYLPLTLLAFKTHLEIYLLFFSGRKFPRLWLWLFFGYLLFVCCAFNLYVRYELSKKDFSVYDCFQKDWYELLMVTPSILLEHSNEVCAFFAKVIAFSYFTTSSGFDIRMKRE